MAIALSPAIRKTLAAGTVSAATLIGAFVAEQEGISLVAYEDAGKVWTICYGHTAGVKKGDVATSEECHALLKTETGRALTFVASQIKEPMSAARHVALADFCYNVGYRACGESTLFKKINARDPQACHELKRWRFVTIKGVKVDCSSVGYPVCGGVWNRRLQEFELCSMS